MISKYDHLELGWYLVKRHNKKEWELMQLVPPGGKSLVRLWKIPNKNGYEAEVDKVGSKIELPPEKDPEPKGIDQADALMAIFGFKRKHINGNMVSYEIIN